MICRSTNVRFKKKNTKFTILDFKKIYRKGTLLKL